MTIPSGVQTLDALCAADGARGRRVLVRADLNASGDAGEILRAPRLAQHLPTLRDLCAAGAQVVVLSHRGRPGGRPDPDLSLAPAARALARLMDRPVAFAADCAGPQAATTVDALTDGGIAVLENTRFHPGETAADPEFARRLAALGDVFVHDAFSVAHRSHASTSVLAALLPACAGRAMAAELDTLARMLNAPERPLAAVVGGAKIATKLGLLESLATRTDVLMIGGGMANTLLAAQGVETGRSLCDRSLLDEARRILEEAKVAGCHVLLPIDAVTAPRCIPDAPTRTVTMDQVPQTAMILDVGPATVAELNIFLDTAATVIWNGPLGAFETPPFDAGTAAAARHVAHLTRSGRITSVAGGGDTGAALTRAGVIGEFSYVSSAGGAFLQWLSRAPLPGVEALRRAGSVARAL